MDAKFDLTLYAREQADGLALQLVYDANLFDAARMRDLLRQFAGLLAQACDAPQSVIADYALVTADARAVLPDPAAPLPDHFAGAVHELLAHHVAQRPDATAITAPGLRWTYRDLDERSERIACWLQAQGVGREDVVALHAERGALLVAALLGVLKAGAAVAILDAAHPPDHLRACIAAARPKAWLQIAPTDPRALLAAPLGATLDLAGAAGHARLAALPDQRAQAPESTADDLALIAFTSGSTGLPKAVEGRHGPLTHFLPWLREHFALGPGDRFAMLSALSHDPLQRDIFTALCLGGELAIPDPDAIAPRRLARWAADAGVTVANLTPALARWLCEAPAGALPALRHVFLVGDVLTHQDVHRLHELAPAVCVTNLYGTTETQRALSWHTPARAAMADGARAIVPLGRGMPGAQLLVLNAAGRQAGIGEQGEIHLRSPHLARGYRDDAALTAQRFRANPFTGAPHDRIYRTGDLGRYLPDGSVEGLGRADTQVKLRGFRIELGAIESLLAQHPGVREAVATVHGTRDDAQLVAYVIARDPPPDAAALRAHLRARLPAAQQPTDYVFLARWPLTPNGKIDRRALPAPAPARPQAEAVAARTDTEARVAALCAAVLGRAGVGMHDDFFDLGGHSLRAAQVLSRVRDAFGVDLPLRRFFETPTAAALAALIDADLGRFEEIEL